MTTKLFVGNLPYSITEEQLRESFADKGRHVRSVRIALDRETQRPRGFAFIEMGSEQDADSAVADLHNQMVAGRTIFVEKAQERAPGAPRPSSSQRPAPSIGARRESTGPRTYSTSTPQDRGPRPPRPIGYQSPPPFEEPRQNRRMKAKPEKKTVKEKRSSGRPEERERGKWRWDGHDDY